MYFNDVHILFYILAAIIGGTMGQFVHYCYKCFLNEKKILSKESLSEYKRTNQVSFPLIIINAVLYMALLYKFGINDTLIKNVDLIKFVVLIPMMLIATLVDFKIQIIPNRLNLLIFEIGLILTVTLGIININIAIDNLLGMVVGGGIFLVITLLGGLIAGKEAMGLGDVKLMGALGLFFGWANIIIIAVIAFLIGAIGSIILLITKKAKDGYIPFGPFIIIAAITMIFVPFEIMFVILMKIFSLGLYK